MNRFTKTVLALSLVTTLANAQDTFFHTDMNDEFNKMQNLMTKVMNSDFKKQYFQDNYPQMNIQNKNDRYVITFNLAGMDKKDIKLSVDDDRMLTIEGTQKEQKSKDTNSFITKEIHIGEFKRTILLPDDIKLETLQTEYNNGILEVTIIKKASKKSHSKIIPIN